MLLKVAFFGVAFEPFRHLSAALLVVPYGFLQAIEMG